MFEGRSQYTQITTLNMYLLNEIKRNVSANTIHGNCNAVKKVVGVLKGDF